MTRTGASSSDPNRRASACGDAAGSRSRSLSAAVAVPRDRCSVSSRRPSVSQLGAVSSNRVPSSACAAAAAGDDDDDAPPPPPRRRASIPRT
eukprot:30888-Pelagococcus_subviridis.AAC.1